MMIAFASSPYTYSVPIPLARRHSESPTTRWQLQEPTTPSESIDIAASAPRASFDQAAIRSPSPTPTWRRETVHDVLRSTAIPIRRSRKPRPSQRLPDGDYVADFSRLLRDDVRGSAPSSVASSPVNPLFDSLFGHIDELVEGQMIVGSDGLDSSILSTQSLSPGSVPSMANPDDYSSADNISVTTSTVRSASDRRVKQLAPSEDCAQEHPLVGGDSDSDSDSLAGDVAMPTELIATPLQKRRASKNEKSRSFKSSLTASLKAIKLAAQSVSNYASTSTAVLPDDFGGASVFEFHPWLTDDRRPPPLDEPPSPALRRYLNPNSFSPPDSPAQLHFWIEQRAETPSAGNQSTPSLDGSPRPKIKIKKKNAKRNHDDSSSLVPMAICIPSQIRTAHASSPPVWLAPDGTPSNKRSAASAWEAAEAGLKHCEPRENPDFLRIYVCEMQMRRAKKLRADVEGRARMWLPPTERERRRSRPAAERLMEEREDSNAGNTSSSNGTKSDSEGDHSDSTIVGRPAGWDPKFFVAVPRKPSRLVHSVTAISPVSEASGPESASPCSSTGPPAFSRRAYGGGSSSSVRSSYSDSESGTVFSDDTVPSLASDPTTFATDSSRNSVASSTKSGRNRYPALLIPRDSWNSMDNPIKEISLPMSPGPKITLSPAILSSLPYAPPSEHATPSLGSSSSVPSESPPMSSLSGPGTPDMRLMDAGHQEWGDPISAHSALVHNPLEIAIDDDHSIMLSPADAHAATRMPPTPSAFAAMLSPREREWGGMVARFPPVPGATPLRTPVSGIDELVRPPLHRQQTTTTTDSGDSFQLPRGALATLDRLTRAPSPDEKSDTSQQMSVSPKEMRERSEPSVASRPRSLDGVTPLTEGSFSKLSDYSFTQLSIPSPGGFFSSLQSGTRHTWCIQPSRNNSMPSSAVAENFYHNWDSILSAGSGVIKETVVAVAEDTNATEGPPTARQPVFGDKTATKDARPASGKSSSQDQEDMYGDGQASPVAPVTSKSSPKGFEYEEAYAEEIKQAAEANLDRTSSWLAAQTSYLSALRDNNPINSPADYLPSPHPFLSDASKSRSLSMESDFQNTVRFLREAQSQSQPQSLSTFSPYPAAIAAATANEKALAAGVSPTQTSPASSHSSQRDPIFFSAFKHLIHDRKKLDAFLHATSRMQAVQADRLARPDVHVANLQGRFNIQAPKRPKYSGPFNHNPRATGIFERTADQLKFEACEREQRALDRVKQNIWVVDALKLVYGGRLLASSGACERLSKKETAGAGVAPSSEVDSKQRLRILDLGGDATAGWGWEAALQWPNVKVYTVVIKEQGIHSRPSGSETDPVAKPQGPENHRVISVPNAWQLPFKSNRFDVITARSLHALLKSKPVPSAPDIDEWDMTLRECMRVLKPGGYLDFLVMDSSLVKSGPGGRGEKISVEFGFELQRRGYDREAARTLLKRLRRQGFVGVKRSWMFWPMGRRSWDDGSRYTTTGWRDAPRPVSEVSTISRIVKQYMDVEAVQGPVGSVEACADVCGLLGQRIWESWVVKPAAAEAKIDHDNTGTLADDAGSATKLLDSIYNVFDEGRKEGAGFRVLPQQHDNNNNEHANQLYHQQDQHDEVGVEEVSFQLDTLDLDMTTVNDYYHA
ncbi:hypothetical protein DV738_g2759, partial [Chaetothyriales sp. CBS 135597]